MDLTSLLFSFEGRVSRGKYWLAMLIYSVTCLMLMMILLGTILSFYQSVGAPSDLNSAIGRLPIYFFSIPLIVISVWSGAAIMMKRLHDRDKSGWWIVLFFVVPVVLNSVVERIDETYAATAVGLIMLALMIWSFVETFCLKGTAGSNRFGPDPLLRVKSNRVTA